MKWRWQVISELLRNPRRGAELGVFSGSFTEQILKANPKLTLYAVDTWIVRPPSDRVGFESYAARGDFSEIRETFNKRTRRFSDRLKVLQMDTVAAANEVADGSLDFVFIDAEHTYEAVGADIDAWRPKVKPGGIISGHDYGHERFPGVKQAVDERLKPKTADDHVWWVRC
jgi:hypothetical protein